jgi:hypothetical protein
MHIKVLKLKKTLRIPTKNSELCNKNVCIWNPCTMDPIFIEPKFQYALSKKKICKSLKFLALVKGFTFMLLLYWIKYDIFQYCCRTYVILVKKIWTYIIVSPEKLYNLANRFKENQSSFIIRLR